MPETYYKDALKSGLKEYRACISKGISPCLPVLDDFISLGNSAGEVNLGLTQIPADRIIGTKSRGRVYAFAPNFMPIMEESSEFADKWEHLCQSHLTEGIRDPIKAYEYMNRYYVEEGNKRVSVLKFFDAVNIAGNVIRILPVRNGDEEIEQYYDFLDFYKYSKINFIELTKKGGYAELQKLMGKGADEEWSEEERKEFSAVYYYFRKAYLQSGGDKLQSTCGDAMLSYIKIYGCHELGAAETSQIKKNLNKMWEEVTLQEEEAPIELKLDPSKEKKPGVLTRVLSNTAPSVTKVAFLYDGAPETSGWVHDHEDGRLRIQRVFEDKIETKAFLNVMQDDPLEVIDKAIEDGFKLIFTTSPRLLQPSLRAAVDHPEAVIMNCSLNKSHRYIRSYYTRMYEVKFILGAIAGSLSEESEIGYVCDYPIFGQIAGINAFALGAQMINPRAKIYLEWSATKSAFEAAKALEEKDIHLISSQDTARFLYDDRKSFGLSCSDGGKSELLATPVWKWGVYYEEIIRRYLNKTMQAEYEASNKALNYYLGMSAGVVDIEYSASLPLPSRRLADFLRQSIIRNVCSPFLTPLYTQSGEKIGEGQKELSLEQIINMDYLVENVVGDIPQYDQLTPMGKATVDTAGVEKAQSAAASQVHPSDGQKKDLKGGEDL